MPPEQLALTDSALTDAAMKSSKKIAGILGGIALFSTANTVLIGLITTSRILYGIAKDGSLPNVLTKTLTKQKTPWVAALVIFFIVALLLPLGKIKTLASIAAFFIMIAFVSVNIALIRLRYTHPNAQRPFRVPMNIGKIPLPTLIAILTCTIFLFQFEHKVYVIGFLVFLVALTIYFISHFLINKKFSIK
jgi:APA family basic amino acid/polyamine antiporter